MTSNKLKFNFKKNIQISLPIPLLNNDDNIKYNVLDLFCGCGGMSYGLKAAGLNIVRGIDIWDIAINSYNKNNIDNNLNHHGICANLVNIDPSTLNINNIDIIVGGPPCQGFSISGKRDSKDPRNSLFMEYVRFLNYFNPKAFIMENVIGILSAKTINNEKVIDIIMSNLNINYNTIICKLYASDFNVPQNRRRVIIIGIRKDLNIIPTTPDIITKERIPVKDILINKENIDKKYFLSEKAIIGINNKRQKSKLNGNGFGAQFLDFNKPSYTIPARYWHDGYDALVKYNENEIRRLTILELKRIQSFPDDYIIDGSNKEIITQIGNAVPPNLAYYLGLHIIKLLNKS